MQSTQVASLDPNFPPRQRQPTAVQQQAGAAPQQVAEMRSHGNIADLYNPEPMAGSMPLSMQQPPQAAQQDYTKSPKAIEAARVYNRLIQGLNDPALNTDQKNSLYPQIQAARDAYTAATTPVTTQEKIGKEGRLYEVTRRPITGQIIGTPRDLTPTEVLQDIETTPKMREIAAATERAAMIKAGIDPDSAEGRAWLRSQRSGREDRQGNYDQNGVNLPDAPAGSVYRRDPVTQQVITDNNGAPIIINIVGGPLDLAAKKEAKAETQKLENTRKTTAFVQDEISRAIALTEKNPNLTTASIGWLLSQAPGTDAYNLGERLSSIKANIAFDKITEMRAASATGAGLGGSTSDNDMRLLTSSVGSLEQKQSAEQLIYNLKRIQGSFNSAVHGKSQFDNPEGAGGVSLPGIPMGAVGYGGSGMSQGNVAQPGVWNSIDPHVRVRKR